MSTSGTHPQPAAASDDSGADASLATQQRVLSSQIRRAVLEQSKRAGVGHIGSALSVADLLAVLFGGVMRIPAPDDSERDRFVLSKGHAALALYAALHATGCLSGEELGSFCVDGSAIATHPDHLVRGIDFSTGSLGQGLAYGVGSALAARMQHARRRAFVLMSDAECNEGSIWEGAMFAAHHRLGNVIVLVDVNGQQALGRTRDILDLEPLSSRWRAFGWDVHDIDGHDADALNHALAGLDADGDPHVVLARTTFGKGVSYMENEIPWHYLPMSDEQYAQALCEIGAPRMRAAFVSGLEQLAEDDPRVMLLTGDLGFMVLEPFAERFPGRFVNVGVAEQCMVGLATGLADAGFIPFVYSIGTFASLRPYEFIRNGPLLHSLPVRIVGVGSGLDYGHNGVTHYALEDVAVMRAQPDMTVIAPADPGAGAHRDPRLRGDLWTDLLPDRQGVRARTGARRPLRTWAPGASRRGRGPCDHRPGQHRRRGRARARVARRPRHISRRRRCLLHPAGPDRRSRHTAGEVPVAVTVESHYVTGGLGSLAAEVIAEHGLNCRLVRHGVVEMPRGLTGTLEFLNDHHGLSACSLADSIASELVSHV